MEKDTIIPVKFFRKLTMKEIEAFTDLLISFEKENNVEVTTISISAVQRRARAKTANENSGLHKHVVIGSCVDCHYSGNGAHGCNRLMDGVTPEIDKSKGVECAHNGYVHYLPFSHDR